jgi:hypothetical protein
MEHKSLCSRGAGALSQSSYRMPWAAFLLGSCPRTKSAPSDYGILGPDDGPPTMTYTTSTPSYFYYDDDTANRRGGGGHDAARDDDARDDDARDDVTKSVPVNSARMLCHLEGSMLGKVVPERVRDFTL